MKNMCRHAAAAAALMMATGCATAPAMRTATVPSPNAATGGPAATANVASEEKAATAAAPVEARRKASPPGGRELPGLLRSTVGFVVPMPGTDMIRVGAVQDGATLQSANRNPSLEGTRQDGIAKTYRATIRVHIGKQGLYGW